MLLFLAACSGGGAQQGDIGFVEGFFGGLIADEPRAALVGREVLSAGGTAADAAVGAYFAMAVTHPGVASLGGGGVCLLHDALQIKTEAIEFLPGSSGDGRFAIPGNIRGMFLLHARYGQLEWSNLLRPAENFAREGHAVSRAFVRDFEASAGALRNDPEGREIFGTAPLREGQLLRQVELGVILANLRTRGPGGFYDGVLGRQFAEAVNAAGGRLTISDLRNYRPQLVEPIRFELGNNFIFFPPRGGGLVAARVWEIAEADDRYEDADAAGRAHLILEAAARSYQAVASSGPSGAVDSADALMRGYSNSQHRPVQPSVLIREDDGHDGASIVAVDNQGRTVACSFTMNGPFGSGVIAPGTGILLANPPGAPRAAMPSLALVANENVGLTFFAAAGSGPVAETVARIAVVTLADAESDMIAAVAAPRVHTAGNPDIVRFEDGMPPGEVNRLRELGHRTELLAKFGRINGFYCPRGLPRVQTCQFVKDPRSFGLAVSSDE
ncbi:MAG: gamma-glutamyltransferase [Alphaproteobacteria bacterium]|nr:gamma-glutamyltransferase [Alphaproteobacteria bacterium]